MNPVLSLLYKIVSVLAFVLPFSVAAQSWTTLITDAQGDGASGTLLDATKLEYLFEPGKDSVYFRITVASISTAQSQNFGVNILTSITGYPEFTFWGAQNNEKWSKMHTVWVSGTPPSNYLGTIGVANAVGVMQSNFTNISSNTIDITLDTVAATIVLAMKRIDFVNNSEMAGGSAITMRIAAAVGSSSSWNDDVFLSGATIKLTGVITSTLQINTLKPVLYPNPAHNQLFIEMEGMEAGQIIITDMLGRIIIPPLLLDNGRAVISTSSFLHGLYWASITDVTGNTYTGKFCIAE